MLEVPASHRALVVSLLQRRLPHCSAMAFGSRVSGWPGGVAAKPYSDLDIALWGLLPPDDLALAHLRADLEESPLPWRVDLSNAQNLPDALRGAVLSHGALLFGKLEQFTLAA